MSSQQPPPADPNPNQPRPAGDGGFTQDVQYAQVTARVPEKVSRGVCSTGAIVLQGPHELVLDFLLRVTQPYHLAARVIVPFSLMPALIGAVQENLNNYTNRFGPPPSLPPIPPNTPMPRIDEIYDDLKLPDDMLAGAYANALMVVHTPAEFCLDFITNIYPRSVVSARVYMSAFHIPRFLESLRRSFDQFQRKLAGPNPPPQLPPMP